MSRILIIEDDPNIVRGLTINLRYEGYDVAVATDGESGVEQALGCAPVLVLLDLMLPRMNGYEVLRAFRRHRLQMPVIVLTARESEVDKLLGFELGADDYVTKPFGLKELLARIKAVLRRYTGLEAEEVPIRFGEIEVDFRERKVLKEGVEIPVSLRELELLRCFIQREGQALSRQAILDAVWGPDYEGTERTIDNFVQRLREKLERDPARPRHFLTIRGHGYRFETSG